MQLEESLERALLGSILLDNRHFREAVPTLSPEDFSLESHRRIFRRMGEMITSGLGVDALTLSSELQKTSELSGIGGATYLVSLDEGLPRTKAVDGYVRGVKEASRLRRARQIGADIMARVEKGTGDARAILAAAKVRITEIESDCSRSSEPVTFQDAVDFASESNTTVDWLIEPIIPRSCNGIIGGHPKAAKSFAALDLAIAASCGTPWMGFRIPRRVKTAVLSREDDPGLTRRRLKKLIAGRAEYAVLPEWMLISTRQHQADFQVTNEKHMDALIDQLKRFGAELVVLDVFRSLHSADENDNTAVAEVLSKVSRIQTELKCATALIHHIAKAEGSGNIFRGLRGASAIHGWMEWGIGISVTNPEEADRANYVRRAEFECKEAVAAPIHFRIRESADHATVSLERTALEDQGSGSKRGKVASILPPPARERRDLA